MRENTFQPDLMLFGGTVRTMDGARETSSAIAISDGVVQEVGDDRRILSLAGPDTERVDLAGRTVVPGFIETHNHPVFYGLTLSASVDAGSPPNECVADIVDRVAEAARVQERGSWVRGYRYDDTLLRDDRHPTRLDLDPASPNHPVCLMHVSGHFCVLNTAGLRAIGVDVRTPDPDGGRIDRDASGEPTGLLAETAAFQAYAAMPAADLETYVAALARAGDDYLAHGITTVHDTGLGLTGGPLELDAYRSAIRSGRFRQHVRAYLVGELVPGLTDGAVEPPDQDVLGVGTDRFRLVGAKMWADGSIQGLTGALEEGYACAPANQGVLIFEAEELTRRVADLDAQGWQVAVHGNGDRAIRTILGAYAALGVRPGEQDSRHRIEHCQMVAESQLAEMAEAGIHASFFIKHVYYWGDRHRDRFLGPERAARIDPLSSAARHGVRFALHSDTPVVPVSPLEGISCAVRRVTRDGHPLGLEQCLDAESALRGYTADAAYLAHEERSAGSLVAGRVADLAVLSGDPVTTSPTYLGSLTVDATVVSGRSAYVRSGVPFLAPDNERDDR